MLIHESYFGTDREPITATLRLKQKFDILILQTQPTNSTPVIQYTTNIQHRRTHR